MCERVGQTAVCPSFAASVSIWGQIVSCSCIIHCRIKYPNVSENTNKVSLIEIGELLVWFTDTSPREEN